MFSRITDSDLTIDTSINTHATEAAASSAELGLSRWEQEQLFEEDLRAVLNMLRPNRAERLLGWSEYRTGGNGFRATISWDPGAIERPARRRPGHNPADDHFVVPQMTDVLESILVGSVRNADEMHAKEEFEIYREVVRELGRRLDEMQRCYE